MNYSIIKDKKVYFKDCKTCGKQKTTVERSDDKIEYWPNCTCEEKKNVTKNNS